jgi:D-alanyl-D-alanine carboxypeptidase (penicillin-binding protein 5/6)
MPVAQAAPTDGTDPLQAPGVLVADGYGPPPVPASGSWLVADLDSGEVLAAQSARVGLAPASTIKMLTALALTPDIADDAVYTGTFDAAAIDGTKVGIVPDSTYSGRDLVHGLLMSSGNDAAQAMTDLAGGTQEAVARMESTADDLGASDTVVANASGLDAPGQVTSARDLALIGRAVLADDRLAPVVVTERYDFPGAVTKPGARRTSFQIGNHNRLLGDYDGIIGVKNGYTEKSRGSLVVAAERNGRAYMVVLMRTEGSVWQQSRVLLDWAFAGPADAEGLTTLDQSIASSEPAAPAQPSSVGDGARRVGAADDPAAHDDSPAAEGPLPQRIGLGLLVAAAFVVTAAAVLLVLRRSVSARARSSRASRHPDPPRAGP